MTWSILGLYWGYIGIMELFEQFLSSGNEGTDKRMETTMLEFFQGLLGEPVPSFFAS